MHYLYSAIIISVLFSCTTINSNEVTENNKRQYLPEPNLVETIVIKKQSFSKELISNGKLTAYKHADLVFEASGVLTSLLVQNKQKVKAGNVIAQIDDSDVTIKEKQANINAQKAELQFQDFLLGQGYSISDSANIPIETVRIAKVKSGYSNALIELEIAKANFCKTKLIVPFTGIIANIKSTANNYINQGEVFCTLIDDTKFEVDFSVLETEYPLISIGKKVRVEPIANNNQIINGQIIRINPIVDKDGLIQVIALVHNPGNLLNGMNVKIIIENQINNQLIVPRSAVVLRQNQEVLFRVINGLAYWTYVNIIDENSTSYAVVANQKKGAVLNAGDTVIITGNLNLAHDSEIEFN